MQRLLKNINGFKINPLFIFVNKNKMSIIIQTLLLIAMPTVQELDYREDIDYCVYLYNSNQSQDFTAQDCDLDIVEQYVNNIKR